MKNAQSETMRKSLLFVILFIVAANCFSQRRGSRLKGEMEVYPSNWWIGMKNPKLQLMLHQEGIGDLSTIAIDYPGVWVEKVHRVESNNYLFVDLVIQANTKPGRFTIEASRKAADNSVVSSESTFELKKRRPGKGTVYAQGVTSKDLIYLLMPDRFSNGDASNDRVAGMRDQSLNRDSIFLRHGGDLQGVINHLDYLKDLGVTTVWLTPVIENDMKERTEHGYAFTNHYHIEPRFGGATMYHQLSDELHRRGMKLMQDAVYNHIGFYHFTVQDPPMKDWLHQWPQFTRTNYKDQTVFDPYAAPSEQKILTDGWFEPMMPDVNQQNPYAANYLIQHAIWSVEEFGVDGWRIDTYIYNDLNFMNRCNKALLDEYPNITMFGETWVHGVPSQSYFCENNLNSSAFKSNLPATTDFQQLFYGIIPAVNENFGWTEGVNKLYTTTSQDFLYRDPMREVIFLDNHDLSRFYSVVGEDTAKYKMGFTWLLTFRGVPEMYYGDEILMTGLSNPDGNVRRDFQGGWAGDTENKFTAAGRNEKENAVFNYIKALANFRKSSTAITNGRMMQYLPVDGLYTYFRYDAKQTIMIVMNTGDKEMLVDPSRYKERVSGFSKMKEITKGSLTAIAPFSLNGKQAIVYELVR
jgi:glycosidase